MKHRILNSAERARTGYTDLFELAYTDFDALTDSAALDVALATLTLGDVVNTVLLEVYEALRGTITGDTITVSVGRTSADYVDCLAASEIANLGTPTPVYTTYVPAATIGPQAIATAAPDLNAQFAITAGTTHLDGLTGGKLRIWAHISRLTDRGESEYSA